MFLKISKYFLYASVFSVLIVLTGSFFPFIGGKYYFFRVLVEIALAFFLIHWAWEDRNGETEKRIKSFVKNPIFIAIAAFAFFFLLAAIFAHNPNAAFWSNFERGEGAFQMLHYFAFFFLLGAVLRTRDDWNWMFRWSVVSGIFMILYGIASNIPISGFVGPYTDLIAQPGSSFWNRLAVTRFQGSLGNPAYVAPMLMFCMFYVGYLWANGKNRSGTARIIAVSLLFSFVTVMAALLLFVAGSSSQVLILGIALLSAAYIAYLCYYFHKNNWGWIEIVRVVGALFLLGFFALFFIFSQTRGAFAGLGISILILLFFLLFTSFRKWSLAILCGLIVIGATTFALRSNPRITNLPASRVLFLSLSDASAQTRLWTWNSAWQGFKERPILGWGPENFSTVFDKYFDPRHYVPGQNSETWFDRAHSIVFDYLAEGGILTFAAYVSMFALFYSAFWKTYLSKKAREIQGSASPVAQALMFSMPVAYLVQGFVLFDVLPIYIFLFIFLGFSIPFFSKHSYS
jgi:O-antigen ligase